MASAKAPTTSVGSRHKAPSKIVAAGVPWTMTQTFKLPDLSVQVGQSAINPTYRVILPNGQKIELAPTVPVDLTGLSKQEVIDAASDTRIILESVLRLMLSATKPSEGLINGPYAQGTVVDPKWLTRNGLQMFDPVSAALEESPMGAKYAYVVTAEEAHMQDVFVARQLKNERDRKLQLIAREQALQATRMGRLFVIVRDAVYTSTIEAAKGHLSGHRDMKKRVQEWGFQLAFRAEMQIGAGPLNITKSFPVMWSFGYNKAKRTTIFRRGFRKEQLDGGSAVSVGLKAELRFYRLIAETVDGADARDGFAQVKGKSWYPPIPFPLVSLVADTAPGYHSYGVAVGINIADFIPGSSFMNTVTSFQEEQRVYSAPLPDPAQWIKKFQTQMNDSSNLFGGAATGGRCEQIFIPTVGSF